MSTKVGPTSGLRPVRLRWSATTMIDPVSRSARMPPAAAVRMTVVQPAAIPVRTGWTTSAGVEALVEVAAPAEDEHPAAAQRHRPALGAVAARGVRREEGEGVERERSRRPPRGARPCPESPVPRTTSTSWCSVPMRRASSRALRAARSAASSMAAMRRGCAAGPGRVTSTAPCPPPPLRHLCTRSPP